MGELRFLYAAADIAFVGGSLFYRGQQQRRATTSIEPAVLGVPVLFGPYHFSFRDTVEDLLTAERRGIRVTETPPNCARRSKRC